MRNGLFSIHVTLGDGRARKGSGVLVFRDGEILGGDAYLFHTGHYTVREATISGAVVVNQHTPTLQVDPLFGGQEVGIGFSGPFTDDAAIVDGTALVGRQSMIFKGTLKRLADFASRPD